MTLKEALASLTVMELKQRCNQIPNLRPGNRKDSLVTGIAGYLLSESLATLVEGLTEVERNAVAETVHNWNGSFRAVGFEAKYGALPGTFTYDPYSYGRSKRDRQPSALRLLFFGITIPTDLAACLAGLVPEPPPMHITTLDDEQLPKTVTIKGFGGDAPEPLQRADTEMMAHQDLPAVLRLIAEGSIAVGAKTGGLAKIDGCKLGLTAKGKKALSQPVHEVVKQLYERWQRKGSPDELRRVDLIKGQTSKGVRLTAPVDRRLVIEDALRASCPVGEWLCVGDLFRQMKAEGYRFEVSGNPWKLYLSEAPYTLA